MSKSYGIDVSDNQGIIDWAAVKNAGCDFAVLRSVRRSGKADYQFANNLAGCRANGIPVAVYKYTYAATEAAQREEARQVAQLLKQNALDCIIWWDVEDRAALARLGKERLTSCIKAARQEIESAGLRFGVYTGKYVLDEKWFDHTAFLDCPWWIARYPLPGTNFVLKDVPEAKKPAVPVPITAWQWTSKGEIAGIQGNVDMNIMYDKPSENMEPEVVMEYFPAPKVYKNGSTPEIVYSSTAASQSIGSLDPREECHCIGTCGGMACVVYTVNSTGAKKAGWVKWLGGICK